MAPPSLRYQVAFSRAACKSSDAAGWGEQNLTQSARLGQGFPGDGPCRCGSAHKVSAAMCSGWDFAWVCQILGIIPGRSVSSRLRKAAPRESRALY